MKKKNLIIVLCFTLGLILFLDVMIVFKNDDKQVTLEQLPKPQITGGARGELGIDKNINEKTIDKYLNREDAVYRDMRMLEDPGKYEAIGGDRFLSGYIDGFEVIPLPYIIPVTGLPSAVGETYTGDTLFYNNNGTFIPNYIESMDIIERVFPKDKIIFLMCGGGGYAGMTKNFLISLGWDENKIYNVGGYWYYKGKNSINVKKEIDGVVSYDFDKVPYHEINFNKLTKSKEYKEPVIKVSDLKINTSKLELEEGNSFQLSVIVLPNKASNKEIKWISSDEKIVQVSENGLIKALKPGSVTITAKSVDGDKKVTCNVIVTKRNISTRIEIDDMSTEIKNFSSYDLDKLYIEYYNKVYNSDGTLKKEYQTIDSEGRIISNDLFRIESDKYSAKEAEFIKIRKELFDKFLNEQKTFIVLIHEKECEEKEYSIVDEAPKIFKEFNYQYFEIGTLTSNGDQAFWNSKLDLSNFRSSSLVIIKNGQIYAHIDSDKDSIKNDGELKSWLGKYLYID